VTEHMQRIETGLNALRHDVNPEARPAPKDRALAAGPALMGYRSQALETFRKRWNEMLRDGYSSIVSAVRNPYLAGVGKDDSGAGFDEEPQPQPQEQPT